MNFPLTDLDGHRFNRLVGDVLHFYLGPSITTFSPGKDQGIDGIFVGTAKSFPDEQNPLSGHFVIQAKWTGSPGTCADPDFVRMMEKDEAPKAKLLAEKGQLDHWLIYTNRRKAVQTGLELETKLKTLSGAKTVHLRGDEDLQRCLRIHQQIAEKFDLLPRPNLLRIRPDEIAEIVGLLHSEWSNDDQRSKFNFDRYPGITAKNEINKMPDGLYKLIEKSSVYFNEIENFLKNPRNLKLSSDYHAIAEEFQSKVLSYCEEYKNFGMILDAIFEEVTIKLPEKFSTLRKRQILRIVLHYMYCVCDIGKAEK